jgi:hypothetical protein
MSGKKLTSGFVAVCCRRMKPRKGILEVSLAGRTY